MHGTKLEKSGDYLDAKICGISSTHLISRRTLGTRDYPAAIQQRGRDKSEITSLSRKVY
jgi:hypothetical protein